MISPVFVTGSIEKANYLSALLGVSLEHQKIDLDEIQSVDLNVIAEHKAREAYKQLHVPVLVEDVSLGFETLDGLPGPFIKFFQLSANGLDNLCKMLDGFDNRRAIARGTFCYYDGEKSYFFSGSLNGQIAPEPRGTGGFGWDKIFIPEGYGGRTRAELSEAEDHETYVKIKAIDELRAFLKTD